MKRLGDPSDASGRYASDGSAHDEAITTYPEAVMRYDDIILLQLTTTYSQQIWVVFYFVAKQFLLGQSLSCVAI